MQYVLILIILLVCGGAYYDHTQMQAQIDGNEAQIASLNSKIDKLTSDNKKLGADKVKLQKDVADQKTSIAGLTTQLSDAQKAVVEAEKEAAEAKKALEDIKHPPPPPPPTNLLGTILTADGKSYSNCKLLKADDDGITISSDTGITKLIYGILPSELQKKLGYDPQSAAKLSEAQVLYLEQQIQAAAAAGN